MDTGTKLRNIGPKSAAWLRQTGIRTQEDLMATGSLAAYVRVKRAGFKPSLNLLYALEGAILGCHWQEIPEDRRNELVAAAGEDEDEPSREAADYGFGEPVEARAGADVDDGSEP